MVQTQKEINNATWNDGFSDLEHNDNRDEPSVDILTPSIQIRRRFVNSMLCNYVLRVGSIIIAAL